MRAYVVACLLALLCISPASAAQQLTCINEQVAIEGMLKSNPDMALETENRYTGADALAVVLSHNANSSLQLDTSLPWEVLVLKITHKKTGAEAPLRVVLIGRNGEICRQGMLPRQLIDRLLATVPGA